MTSSGQSCPQPFSTWFFLYILYHHKMFMMWVCHCHYSPVNQSFFIIMQVLCDWSFWNFDTKILYTKIQNTRVHCTEKCIFCFCAVCGTIIFKAILIEQTSLNSFKNVSPVSQFYCSVLTHCEFWIFVAKIYKS